MGTPGKTRHFSCRHSLPQVGGDPSRSFPADPLLEESSRRCPNRPRRSAKCPGRKTLGSRPYLQIQPYPACPELDLLVSRPIATFVPFRPAWEQLFWQYGPRLLESESTSRDSLL